MSDALLGLQVRLPTDCKCGANVATIGASDGKYFAVLRCDCGHNRGQLTEFTGKWIEAVAARFGAPTAITIRASAIVAAGEGSS